MQFKTTVCLITAYQQVFAATTKIATLGLWLSNILIVVAVCCKLVTYSERICS